MAEFISEKLEKTNINNGVEFRNGDSPSASDFNNLVKGVLYNNENGSGGTSITVDSAFSTTSTNPLQNKVITEKINELKNSIPKEVVVDAELSTVSTNPVQNKIITGVLDGKLDKFEPKYNNTMVVWAVKKRGDGSTSAFVKEISGSVKADIIPITGSGGTLRIGNPTVDAQAVNLGYMKANIGHRYKFTCVPSGETDGHAIGETFVFYYDTKTNIDTITATATVDILNQMINNKAQEMFTCLNSLKFGYISMGTASENNGTVSFNTTEGIMFEIAYDSNYVDFVKSTTLYSSSATATMEKVY